MDTSEAHSERIDSFDDTHFPWCSNLLSKALALHATENESSLAQTTAVRLASGTDRKVLTPIKPVAKMNIPYERKFRL